MKRAGYRGKKSKRNKITKTQAETAADKYVDVLHAQLKEQQERERIAGLNAAAERAQSMGLWIPPPPGQQS